ncbi:MAG: DUF928 domain-containing protein [Cyanobacteria bacterium J06597_16]
MKFLRQHLRSLALLSLTLMNVLSVGVASAETEATETQTAQTQTAQTQTARARTARARTAETRTTKIIETPAVPRIVFEPPNDQQINRSRGGASRPTEVKCAEDDTYPHPLTALVPDSGLGLTTRSHPTLHVYVPPTTATQAHFTLRDAQRNGLYQAQLPIAPSGGIWSITLPAGSPELLVGHRYEWSLALLCRSPQTDMPVASGYLERVAVSEAAALTEQPLARQVTTYGEAGVWHDMLASLAQLQQSQPANRELSADWAELLQTESLGAIAHTPLLYETLSNETVLFPSD